MKKRLFAGSRSLLLVAAFAVAAAMCTVSTAHAASSAVGAGSTARMRTADSHNAAASDYGAWAWSIGKPGTPSSVIPSSVSSAFGSSPAQAEAAAVQACAAAGGGTGGAGPCFARVWFQDAYSSLAASGNGAWGVSWAATSAEADSDALSGCSQSGTGCQVVGRAQTADTTAPDGAVLQATPSYGVWAISPSAQLVGWSVGDSIRSAQQAAVANCESAGGLAAECATYGAWTENAYSAISMGANGSWSISTSGSPANAAYLAQHECQTVKAPGLKCMLKGAGVTGDPWVGTSLGWIDQPMPLPTTPSPKFVCVTGPGGSCLQPGAGIPLPSTWTPTPSPWLTSPVTGGCVLDFLTLKGGDLADSIKLFQKLGGAVRWDESAGSWIVLLTAAIPFQSCAQLLSYLVTGKTPPAAMPESVYSPTQAAAQNPFRTVPKSQLKKLTKLPFVGKRFAAAVVQFGAAEALSNSYPTTLSKGAQESVACLLQKNVYRCNWLSRLHGKRYQGYVLIKVAGKSYHLVRVVRLKG
jgi:hypothetical protein